MTFVRIINSDTICSLQIFEDESHPNFHMQGKGGRGKEGLSLFGTLSTASIRGNSMALIFIGILNSTKTPAGFILLKQWFLRPTLSIEELHQRHSSIAFFLKPQHTHIVTSIRKSLAAIKNIPKILSMLNRGKGRASEWKAILQVCYPQSPNRDSYITESVFGY